MKSLISTALLSVAFAGVPMLIGCDDKATTSKETVKTNSDGTTTVDKSKTSVDSNGNTSSSTEHKTTP